MAKRPTSATRPTARKAPPPSISRLGTPIVAYHFFTMSTPTVSMPDEGLTFLRAHSAANGISAEQLLAQQVRNLREHLQRPLHPAVIAATGIIASDIDGREAHRTHFATKHA